MLKIAYCGKPHLGGTYTVFRLLREGLAKHNIELRWVSLVATEYQIIPSMTQEINFGEFIYEEIETIDSAQKFINHIENNYQGIIFNVLANSLETNIARYLSNNILKIQIVHNITPATYLAAKAINNYVHRTICPTPRIANDLINQFDFEKEKVVTISHAVSLDSFTQSSAKLSDRSSLKLVYLGRIEENAKGVLWLPEILQECLQLGIDASLTIVGSGQDLEQLKSKVERLKLAGKINFYGKARPEEIPQILASHQIFVMPSRYEGFGYSLVEAMASGCVPICSEIEGVTNFIVDREHNGFVFPIGDTKKAALYIKKLADEKLWQQFSNNAKKSVMSRFTLTEQAKSYADLIYQLKDNPSKIAKPLDINNWYLPPGLKPRLATYLPSSLKNIVRAWRERLYLSV